MVGEDLLGQRLVVRECQAARIASRVRLLQQLQVADDVLIEQRVAVELFEQVECNLRLVFLARISQ